MYSLDEFKIGSRANCVRTAGILTSKFRSSEALIDFGELSIPKGSKRLAGGRAQRHHRKQWAEHSILEGSQHAAAMILSGSIIADGDIRWWRFADHRLIAGNPPG